MREILAIYFSFCGRIHRLTFFFASLIQGLISYAIVWVTTYFFTGFILGFILNSHRLVNTLKAYATSKKSIPLSTLTSNPEFKTLIIGLAIPMIIGFVIPMWITFALYIKRYRDIGVAWPITLLLMFLPYIFLILVISEPNYFTFIRSWRESSGNAAFVLTYLPAVYILAIYLIIPIFWPPRRDHNILN